MDITETVRSYYESLEAGEPLGPYFREDDGTVKVGIGGQKRGHESVVDALTTQTATTTDWQIQSHALLAIEREGYGWFADEVTMAWRDTEANEDRRFESRWTGTLERVDGDWRFATMHVSAPHEL